MFPESLDNPEVVSIHHPPPPGACKWALQGACGKASSSLKDKQSFKVRLESHKSEADSPWSTKTQPNTLSPRPWPSICSNAVFRPGWGGHLGHQASLVTSYTYLGLEAYATMPGEEKKFSCQPTAGTSKQHQVLSCRLSSTGFQGPREEEQEPVGPAAWSEEQVFLQGGQWPRRRTKSEMVDIQAEQ